jgi:hypothetical protein
VRASESVVPGKGKPGFFLLRSALGTIQICVVVGHIIPVELAKFVQTIPVDSLIKVFGTHARREACHVHDPPGC